MTESATIQVPKDLAWDLFSGDVGAQDKAALQLAISSAGRDEFEFEGSTEKYFFQPHRLGINAVCLTEVRANVSRHDMYVCLHRCHELDWWNKRAAVDFAPAVPPQATTPFVLWSLPRGLDLIDLRSAIHQWKVGKIFVRWSPTALRQLQELIGDCITEQQDLHSLAQTMCDAGAFMRGQDAGDAGDPPVPFTVVHDGSDRTETTLTCLVAWHHLNWVATVHENDSSSSWLLTALGMGKLLLLRDLELCREVLDPICMEQVDPMKADRWTLLCLLHDAGFSCLELPTTRAQAKKLPPYQSGGEKVFYMKHVHSVSGVSWPYRIDCRTVSFCCWLPLAAVY